MTYYQIGAKINKKHQNGAKGEKQMKKILTLLLALALSTTALLAVACGSGSSLNKEDVVGTWVATKLIVEEVTTGEEREMELPMELTYVFNDDNTMEGGGAVATWEIDGDEIVLSFDGEEQRYTINSEEVMVAPTPDPTGEWLYKWYLTKQD